MKADRTAGPIRMKEPRRMNLLATPLFVVSISLLALNDFVFKTSFHNWLTGKLSDIAGLMGFAVFACAIWPARRWVVATAISAAFILWKSPYSQPVIDFINGILPFNLGRIPDYSDCIALPGVWLTCWFIVRLHPWPMRNWIVGVTAVLSLFLFTATSYIPMHRITRTALIPTSNDQSAIVEKQLQDLFDNVASQHGLRCMVCDPLSGGRLYVKSEADPPGFSLSVNFDADRAVVFFDASSIGPEAIKSTPEIGLIRTEVENQLQALFPNLKTEEGKRPKGTTLQLGVRKKNSKTSYEAPENREDYEKAVEVIDAVVARYGFKRSTPTRYHTVFYTGRLFGPRPSDHELAVSAGIADWPLVPIDVTAYSPKYSELQREIADELEQKLQAAFGKDRAWVRWGSRK